MEQLVRDERGCWKLPKTVKAVAQRLADAGEMSELASLFVAAAEAGEGGCLPAERREPWDGYWGRSGSSHHMPSCCVSWMQVGSKQRHSWLQ